MKSKNITSSAPKERSKTFSGFRVSLRTDSKLKKRLSNHLQIAIDTDPIQVSQRLTIREARALQKWLNEELGEDSV